MDPDDAAADAPETDTAGAAARPDGLVPDPTQPGERRTRHRRTIWQRLVLAFNCVVVLACFAAAVGLVVARELRNGIKAVDITLDGAEGATATTTVAGGTTVTGGTLPVIADSDAQNFLVVGVDNNSCVPPDSPYYGGVGQRSENLSDTIMVIRVDPETKRAAVLSFPRDLWVLIAERNVKGKINSAYQRDKPARLVATIKDNFGITIDHYIQLDFCAFRTIVNAIGGIDVPFVYPTRDRNTGLYIPTAQCYHFDGDSGLAYVRSRHYEYQDAKGKWNDGSGDDYGRIRRQQDFLRRVLQKALDHGLFDVSVARGLIDAAQKYVKVDEDLTLNKMLEFLGVLRNVEPGALLTYQMEVKGTTAPGSSATVAALDSPTMAPILALFRGQAELAPADADTAAEPTTTEAATASATPTTATGGTATTTVPGGVISDPQQDINRGIVPPDDPSCT
jgi:LCP family protein required for cell wall assembly